MNYQFILGVDVSKAWLNFCLRSKDLKVIQEWEIDNNPEAILLFLNKLIEQGIPLWTIIIVLEHTGLYVNHLVKVALGQSVRISLVHAPKVSNLLTGQVKFQEKNDKLDARRLSEYGVRFTDKLQLWQAEANTIKKIKYLQSQRKRNIKALNLLEVPINEAKSFEEKEIVSIISDNQSSVLAELKKTIKKIEKDIDDLIKNDPNLDNFFKLLTSIKGVGKVTAREVIVTTKGFTNFSPEQGKSFARYSGVIPGSKQSGKKKGRDRIPKRANKKIKSLLTMGAISLIGTNSDLGRYYQRKKQEGKEHLWIINAMRNKLILRMFAVIRKNVMYDENLNISLD